MMQGTWRRKLVDRHPELFRRDAEGNASVEGCPFVGEGWRDLVEVAVERIAAYGPRGSLRIERLEEKSGTLFMRVLRLKGDLDADTLDAVGEVVAKAEARSACTCQICGAPGVLHDHEGWFATLCSEHARGEIVPVRPGWEGIEVLMLLREGRLRPWRARRYDRPSDSFTDVDLSFLEDE